MKKHKKAFTIIELIAGIVIGAVLISIVLPKIIASAREARYKACRGQIAIINEQVELFYTQTGEWPRADLMDLVWDTDRFPDGMPRCPSTGYFYWLYEDTRRVGGHNENTPESHKMLGYMTIGDSVKDSQGNLTGQLIREFDVDSNQYALVRYGDYKYELMKDGKTWKKVSYIRYKYNAYGSLVSEALCYDIQYDEKNRMTGQSTLTKDRRGQIMSDTDYKYSYDAEGARKTVSAVSTQYYLPSGGQIVKQIVTTYYNYDPATGVYAGYAQTSCDAGGSKLGEVEISFGERWDSGPGAGKVKTKTMTYKDKDGSPTMIETFENIEYDLDGRGIAWTVFMENRGVTSGKIEYTSGGYDAEGVLKEQNWKYFNYIPATESGGEGTYEYAGERKIPSSDWDFEHGKREGFQRNTSAEGRVENRNYYIEYDEYGKEKFARFVFRNEENAITSIIENSNYSYDSATGLRTGGTQTVLNPDRSIRTDKTSKDFQYDSAGRLTAYAVEATDRSDGSTVKIEFSDHIYEGPPGANYSTVTSYRRKSTKTVGEDVHINYDYELRDIRRKVSGGLDTYTWIKHTQDGPVEGTCPPVCPHGSGW